MSTLDVVLTQTTYDSNMMNHMMITNFLALTQSGLNCTLICIKQNKSKGLRRECKCVHSEYSTLSCKCKTARVFCMPSSAKQKKTHKKHRRREGTIQ